MENNIVYHYCTVETFLNIIKNHTLRLSDLCSSNDKAEMKILFSNLKNEILNQYRKREDFFETIIYGMDVDESFDFILKRMIYKMNNDINQMLFGTCFSEKAMVYIVYILDDNSDNIPIQIIESNKTYGRKYVFSEDETITFINGIVKTSNEEIGASPVQEWDRILREEHLTACLTESYAAISFVKIRKNWLHVKIGKSFKKRLMWLVRLTHRYSHR